MDMKIIANELFATDVISLKDYNRRIKKIKEVFSNPKNCGNGEMNFDFYFRGDKACMPIKSKLFQYGFYPEEDQKFSEWQNNCKALKQGKCDGSHCGDLLCLAYMQHFDGKTRLLDFTDDPLVALRFACGEYGENCRKKVIVFCAEKLDLRIKTEENKIIEDELIKLVKSKDASKCDQRIITKDWFIKIDYHFERISRQKGLFMYMGNGKMSKQKCTLKKKEHELHPDYGRGKLYPGYVGVLNIDSCAVEKIRDKLEMMEKYKMDYLMDRISEAKQK